MSRIKVYRPELDAARGRTGALVSGCERAGQRAGSVAGAMYDMRFTGRDELIGELRSIESRLRKQAERMERLGKMIAAAGDELAAADTASGNSARSLWSRSGASLSGRTAKTALSLSSAAALERNSAAAGLFLSGGATGLGAAFGSKTITTWFQKLFGKKKNSKNTAKTSTTVDKDATCPVSPSLGNSLGGPIAELTTDPQYLANLEYQQKIADMRNNPDFAQGRAWGFNDRVDGIDAIGCASMAKQMRQYVMGDPGNNCFDYPDPGSIQRGDVIYYHLPGFYEYQGEWYQNEHWVYVIDVNKETGILSIGEGNYGEQVNYREISINDFNGYYADGDIEGGNILANIWR